MKGTLTLQELVRDAGINPVLVRHPLPPPSQPAVTASEEDQTLARNLLVEQRKNNPEYRDPSKQLKRIFRSSKGKEKLNPGNWEFSQDELDQALSAVIDKPTSSSGLVQAFLSLGAKVNLIETSPDKRSSIKLANVAVHRRSTVLQRAVTVRRADSVGLLASAGADQTTLDEALKAAIASNDQPCIQELLRHGADINKFPNALANAVRSNDQNLIRLLLRAPKAVRTEIVSSCLPAAVQLKSEQAISLLVGYGADPNFNGASALCMAISQRQYRLAVALVAGPIRLTPLSLQGALNSTTTLPTSQETFQYLQLLLCCGLSPQTPGVPNILARACKRNDTRLAFLLMGYGVSASINEAECLQSALSHSNWELVDAILQEPLSSTNASTALGLLPVDVPKRERLRIIGTLLQHGATGPHIGRWLIRAVEESDAPLMDLLLHAGAGLGSGSGGALQLAVLRKDGQSLRTLLNARPPPQALSEAFPLLRQGYSPQERLEVARLLLEHGARGTEVDQALVHAIGDTPTSKEMGLITELVRQGASVDYDNGKAIQLASSQADMVVLQLLCKSKPSTHTTSAALPLAFRSDGKRHATTLHILQLLLGNGIEEKPLLETLRLAVSGGAENLDIIDCLLRSGPKLVSPAFRYASELSNRTLKCPILAHLLQIGVPQEALNDALVAEIKLVSDFDDIDIVRLLLKHGASVNHNSGEALGLAISSGSAPLAELLLTGKEAPSSSTITRAFRNIFKEPTGNNGSRTKIAQDLLEMGVDQPAIDSALRMVLDDTHGENDHQSMVDLLLSYHANVNTADGTCFIFAARRKDSNILAQLLVHQPDFGTIVPTLISSKLDEDTLVRALRSCFDHGLTTAELENANYRHFKTPSLILAMQEYPRGDSLVKLLLNHGCNPDITTSATIEPAVGEENVSALMWALAQPQKLVSTSVLQALLAAKASPTRSAPISELSPVALAAREGRQEIVQELLKCGADASVRDKWNRSALFYASSSVTTTIFQSLAEQALKDDGSLHEAARCLQVENAIMLVKQGHNPNFPSRLHSGRNALGELCLNAEVTNGSQRTKARQLIRLFLDNGANPKFKARNERSAVVLALDNPHNPLEVTDALLETGVWEGLNDEKHMYRDEKGLWYSPIKYVELVPSPSRARHVQELMQLLGDKGCEPKYYSENPEQPQGAIGMPAPIAKLADRQKDHQLSLKLAKEANDHARMLDEQNHRDALRRKQEQQDAEMAAAAAAQAQWKALEQSKHEFEIQRVQNAERMKRSEKIAWHNLLTEQERDSAAQRQQIEDRRGSAAYAQEAKLAKQRQAELEHRTGLERKALLEKEQLFERNVTRQKQLTDRLDESAKLHAGLRQERPAIEPAKWGSVD